jgi:lysophospholipase
MKRHYRKSDMGQQFFKSIIVFGLLITGALGTDKVSEHFVKGPDGTLIRVVDVKGAPQPNSDARKVVVFLPGRASFFEKNKELSDQITAHPIDFWTLDYKGHGKSGGRLAPGDQRCDIDTFRTYIDEIDYVVNQVVLPHYRNQKIELYLVGASLGGHLTLRYIQDKKPAFEIQKILLISPMIDFFTKPFPRPIAWFLVKVATLMGFGEHYAFGYGRLNLTNPDFSRFKGHHNKHAFDETNALLSVHPELITSGPTFRWVSEAFDSVDHTLELQSLDIPVVVFLAGQDQDVNNKTTHDFLKHFKKVKFFEYPQAYHNLTKETDEYAPNFYKELIEALN